MSRKARTSDIVDKRGNSSRRTLLKRAVIGLGASVILQPNGGSIFGLAIAQEIPKKAEEMEGSPAPGPKGPQEYKPHDRARAATKGPKEGSAEAKMGSPHKKQPSKPKKGGDEKAGKKGGKED
jgi:hypothetical protein